jgi:hypothetical protein
MFIMVSATPLPDFTGVWDLNFERSTLRGPAPKRVLIAIAHREPALTTEILCLDANGAERRQTLTYRTGAETANSIGEVTVRSNARWQGMELVIESRMETPGREAYFKDCWSLSGDGRTLTMAHRDDDLAGQVSVLERRPGPGSPVRVSGYPET